MTEKPLPDAPPPAGQARPGGARRPVKFSGLVGAGVISAEPAPGAIQQFSNAMPAADAPRAAPDAAMPTQWELVDERVCDLDTDLIDDSPYQPEDESRDRYNAEAIDELAHTMANAGQQEPIMVRMRPAGNGRFELIAGHRRIRAARSLGWTKIRAHVVRKSDHDAEKSVMVHNEGRKDLSDYARAKLYHRAKSKGYAKKQDEIARMFGTKQGSVSKRLAMLTLPQPIIDLLDEQNDLISMNTAGVIHELIDQYPNELDLITRAVMRIKTEDANENSVRGWVAQMLQSKTRTTTRPGRSKPKVITDTAGRQLYTAKLEGRVITLRVSAPDVDPDLAMERLVEFFQTQAKEKNNE